MRDTALLLMGWILVVAVTAVLLRYRLLLHYYDRQLLKWAPEHPNPLHDALQARMTHIDRWGVSLTLATAAYPVLFVIYSLYRALTEIAHAILRLLSYI